MCVTVSKDNTMSQIRLTLLFVVQRYLKTRILSKINQSFMDINFTVCNDLTIFASDFKQLNL